MSTFLDTFAVLRERRRMSLRELGERAAVPVTTIHRIAHGTLLPDYERTVALADAFAAVAAAQGAEDPRRDARELLRARETTVLVEEQGMPTHMAEALTSFRDLLEHDTDDANVLVAFLQLGEEDRADLLEILGSGMRLQSHLAKDQRRGAGRNLERAADLVQSLKADEQRDAVMRFAEAFHAVLSEIDESGADAQDRGPDVGAGTAVQPGTRARA